MFPPRPYRQSGARGKGEKGNLKDGNGNQNPDIEVAN